MSAHTRPSVPNVADVGVAHRIICRCEEDLTEKEKINAVK